MVSLWLVKVSDWDLKNKVYVCFKSKYPWLSDIDYDEVLVAYGCLWLHYGFDYS